MAKLVTDHDPYHVHKMLGLFSMMHFVYRIFLLFRWGDAFPSWEPLPYAVSGVFMHGLLSWSSLLLPLSSTRNFSSPMIWPEFRLHSILFASRHVAGTLLTLYGAWPTNPLPLALANGVAVVGTSLTASLITRKLGDKEKRTTNALPYPTSVTIAEQQKIKEYYARAQFTATFVSVMHDPTVNFFCLLGIQSAPFLMTLVRKGKIGAREYHRFYAFSLWLAFVLSIVRLSNRSDFAFFGLASVSAMAVRHTRMTYNTDPRALWAAHLILLRFVLPNVAPYFSYFDRAAPALLYSSFQEFNAYMPLFEAEVA